MRDYSYNKITLKSEETRQHKRYVETTIEHMVIIIIMYRVVAYLGKRQS